MALKHFGQVFLLLYALVAVLMLAYVNNKQQELDLYKLFGDYGKLEHSCPRRYNTEKDVKFRKYEQSIWFLSAYYDKRLKDAPYIRILALAQHTPEHAREIYCLLRNDSGSLISIKAHQYEFNENHNMRYGGFVFSCPLAGDVTSQPCSVDISAAPSGHLVNHSSSIIRLPLSPVERKVPRYEFTVCIPPLFGHLDARRLVEFIELSRLLGAEHLFFYLYPDPRLNGVANLTVRNALSYYREQGMVTVFPWELPVPVGSLWYYGQVLAIHHCLYHNMYLSKFTLFNDIDEFLVPARQLKWREMMQSLDTTNSSGFRFVSAFFPPKPSFAVAQWKPAASLVTMTNVQRTRSFSNVRTKCAVLPDRIFEMGIHHISKQNVEEWLPVNVAADVAVLHHYRDCISGWGVACGERVDDRSLLQHKPALQDRCLQAFLGIGNGTGRAARGS